MPRRSTQEASKQTSETLKSALRKWAHEQLPRVEHMLTLTLKQHKCVSGIASRINPQGYKSVIALDEELAAKVCAEFIQRLNAQVFRTAAKRYGKSLFYLPTLERSARDRLHLHILIGAIPSWAAGVKLYRAIGRAAKHTEWLDRELNMVEADAYALNYVTKQVERHNTNAILWQCIPVASQLHQFAALTPHAF